MKRILFGFIFALILFQVAYAQLQESVDVELVETYVSVLDSDGNPVTDLSANDFVIKEDGTRTVDLLTSRESWTKKARYR